MPQPQEQKKNLEQPASAKPVVKSTESLKPADPAQKDTSALLKKLKLQVSLLS